MNLSIMLAILLEFRIKIQMKVQNEKIIIDQHVDDHSSNVLHCYFEWLNVIRDVFVASSDTEAELRQNHVM